MPKLLGVLGGMGPLATADFMRKLTELTPASRDQDHIPAVVYSNPQVPDRSTAIMGKGESPLPALLEGIARLQSAGAEAIAIPCNTAHYWYDEMAAASRVPILHIVGGVCDVLRGKGIDGGAVGVMGTAGTLHTGIYQGYLQRSGYTCVLPSEAEMAELVMPGIVSVKAGDLAAAKRVLGDAARRLGDRGARMIVLGCTEIPLALADASPEATARYVDSTAALAQACVAWAHGRSGAAAA
ncbi:MAG: aspartate/glutamate racemase family protein [Alphaproteobacteria bacterium]